MLRAIFGRLFRFEIPFSQRIMDVAKMVAANIKQPEIVMEIDSYFQDSDELAFDMLSVVIDEHEINDQKIIEEMFKMVRDFKQVLEKSRVSDFSNYLWYEQNKSLYETD